MVLIDFFEKSMVLIEFQSLCGVPYPVFVW